MNALRRADVQAILDLLVDVGEIGVDRPYPREVVERLRDVVRCDVVLYEEFDPHAKRNGPALAVGPDGTVAMDGESETEDDALYWTIGPCPIVQHRLRTGDLAAVRLSDLVDRRRYRELPIYRDYYAPARIEHMLDLGLPPGHGWHRSLLFYRRKGERDFSDRDRAVLEALRPHLARLEAEAVVRRRLAEAMRQRDPAGAPDPCDQLTAREREVVDLVSEGKTNAEVGAQLRISAATVKKHLEHVYEKLGVSGRTAAAVSVHAR